MQRSDVLLLTDIVDSTQITQQLGDADASALWQAHDRQARALLAACGGREIDKSDGMLVIFDRIADAVAFASGYHRVLAALQPPLRARVGIHTGALWLRENPADEVARGAKMLEVDGLAKAVAARVMTLARGGQTMLSEPAHAALQATVNGAGDSAVDLWETCPHGHWRLKGVPEPMAVWAVGADADLAPEHGAKAWRVVRQDDLWLPAQQLPHSLPAERDRFFGRRDVLARMRQLVAAGVRLITLAGMGGMGKTRLAQHYGWQAQGEFTGGIWFCDLSAAQSADGLLHAVAQGLQLPLTGADPVAQIGQAMARRGECLVLLDNFEQIVRHAADTLGRWLDAAPSTRFIVTTRELLGLRGEEVLVLDPLATEDGIQLFTARAESTAGQPLNNAQPEALAQLVAMLDGLPLALELAASRARVMPPEELLRRLTHRFRLLAGSSDRPDRQATMRAALDWSWDLLSPHEGQALAQLSVFEGGFTLPMAEALVELHQATDAPWTVDLLQSLTQKSLLRAQPGGRFDQLRTVQDYAAERLVASGQCDAARDRHVRVMADLAGHALARGRTEVEDLGNLVTAARHASQARNAQQACVVTSAAWDVLRRQGPIALAAELADLALACATPGTEAAALAHAVAGGAAAMLGQLPRAVAQLRTGLAVKAAGMAVQIRLRCALAECLGRQGQHAEAGQLLREAQALAMAQPAMALRCLVLNELGDWWFQQTRLTEAERCFSQALDWARGAGDRSWEGGLLGNLGAIAHLQGQAALAQDRYESALAMAGESADRRWEGNTRCNLGLLHQEAGRHAVAAAHFDAAIGLARHLGHRRLEATVQCNLGLLLEDQARLDEAIQAFECAATLAESAGDLRSAGQASSCLGLAQARAGHQARARQAFADAHRQLMQVNDAVGLGLMYCAQAEAAGLAGDTAASTNSLEMADGIFRQSGANAESPLGQRLAAVSKQHAAISRC